MSRSIRVDEGEVEVVEDVVVDGVVVNNTATEEDLPAVVLFEDEVVEEVIKKDVVVGCQV